MEEILARLHALEQRTNTVHELHAKRSGDLLEIIGMQQTLMDHLAARIQTMDGQIGSLVTAGKTMAEALRLI